MIITGNFYQTATNQNTTAKEAGEAAKTDSLAALRTFFDEQSESETTPFDSVNISSKALSVLKEYVQANGTTEDDPLASLLKETSIDKFFQLGSGKTAESVSVDESALDEFSDVMKAYNAKEVAEVFEKIRETNRQLSDDFISTAARYGVQSLL